MLPRGPKDRREMKRAQREDDTLKDLRDQADSGNSCYTIRRRLLYKKSINHLGEDTLLLVLPRECRRRAFKMAHTVPMAGHFGSRKTVKKLTQCFYWPQISKDVGDWTRECLECQKHNKGNTH